MRGEWLLISCLSSLIENFSRIIQKEMKAWSAGGTERLHTTAKLAVSPAPPWHQILTSQAWQGQHTLCHATPMLQLMCCLQQSMLPTSMCTSDAWVWKLAC